jgi:hypothetical protein
LRKPQKIFIKTRGQIGQTAIDPIVDLEEEDKEAKITEFYNDHQQDEDQS